MRLPIQNIKQACVYVIQFLLVTERSPPNMSCMMEIYFLQTHILIVIYVGKPLLPYLLDGLYTTKLIRSLPMKYISRREEAAVENLLRFAGFFLDGWSKNRFEESILVHPQVFPKYVLATNPRNVHTNRMNTTNFQLYQILFSQKDVCVVPPNNHMIPIRLLPNFMSLESYVEPHWMRHNREFPWCLLGLRRFCDRIKWQYDSVTESIIHRMKTK